MINGNLSNIEDKFLKTGERIVALLSELPSAHETHDAVKKRLEKYRNLHPPRVCLIGPSQAGKKSTSLAGVLNGEELFPIGRGTATTGVRTPLHRLRTVNRSPAAPTCRTRRNACRKDRPIGVDPGPPLGPSARMACPVGLGGPSRGRRGAVLRTAMKRPSSSHSANPRSSRP
jgi:hypothetical protein